mmetsp:Transcript_93652/g.200877  ORF Transcript_93652/g.200877 Transcript_93652/m.200877 type:complete len:119 (-) Transcript_93652:2-358(-)
MPARLLVVDRAAEHGCGQKEMPFESPPGFDDPDPETARACSCVPGHQQSVGRHLWAWMDADTKDTSAPGGAVCFPLILVLGVAEVRRQHCMRPSTLTPPFDMRQTPRWVQGSLLGCAS